MNDPQDTVRVEQNGDQWKVLVRESGITTQHTFGTEAYATSFSAGQRFRLGILASERVATARKVVAKR